MKINSVIDFLKIFNRNDIPKVCMIDSTYGNIICDDVRNANGKLVKLCDRFKEYYRDNSCIDYNKCKKYELDLGVKKTHLMYGKFNESSNWIEKKETSVYYTHVDRDTGLYDEDYKVSEEIDVSHYSNNYCIDKPILGYIVKPCLFIDKNSSSYKFAYEFIVEPLFNKELYGDSEKYAYTFKKLLIYIIMK